MYQKYVVKKDVLLDTLSAQIVLFVIIARYAQPLNNF